MSDIKKYWLQTSITTAIVLLVTAAIYLYTSGYRVSRVGENNSVDLQRTGIINVKSIPDGATVYIDDVLTTATDDTIQGLQPGMYNLRISKNGFVDWSKDVEVFEELVTDITAVMISQTPRLEPLTNTGAREPVISPTLTKLAYFTKDENAPGIWVIPLAQSGLGLFRSNPYTAIEDTQNVIYSDGLSIEWAPDESELLVQDANGNYHLIDLETNSSITILSPDTIRERWSEDLLVKRTDFLQSIAIPSEMQEIAVSEDSLWAPDDKKFLYTQEKDGQIEYRVYNMEKPIPVGEKVDTLVFTLPLDAPRPDIAWYADSFHLIFAEGNIEEENRGSINMIRIDGSNKTEIYNNTLHSNKVFSAPAGDKIIVLTSFKSSGQTDLYTIGIR